MGGIRSIAFWLIDKLKGGKIRRHFVEVKENVTKENVKGLNLLLTHASSTTSFYKPYKKVSLQDFPIIDKMILRNQQDKFISTLYKKEDLSRAVTSGSTGTPFVVFHDANKQKRNAADTLVFAEKAGFKLGALLYYFKIWNSVNKKSPIKAWMENVKAIDVTELSDHSLCQLLESISSDKRAKHFIGYASAFDSMCAYMERNPSFNKLKIHSAIAMSESLNSVTKEKMKHWFNVDVVSRYSNVENGIIAQQEPGESDFQINNASYKVEILELNQNKRVKEGQPGRIVVTDIYNYAMPLIRYDTGDVGVMSINDNGVKVLTKIEGRKMDMVFNTNGELVSSFTITNQMWKYPEVIQYQFLQKGQKKYEFVLNTISNFDKEKELIEEFKEYFGKDSVISIQYTNEIPLLSSGKRRKVVQEYYK